MLSDGKHILLQRLDVAYPQVQVPANAGGSARRPPDLTQKCSLKVVELNSPRQVAAQRELTHVLLGAGRERWRSAYLTQVMCM